MWYVARLKAGKQTQAAQDFEDAGLTIYIPRMKREVKHFRTKAWMVREYQLFTGYGFADLGQADLCKVHDMRNVLGLLSDRDGAPVPIMASVVRDLMEAEARGDFDVLRPPARRLQAGQSVMVKDGPFAGHHVAVKSVVGRRAIKAVVEILGAMREVELGVENIRLVA